jgi:aspartate racemase
MLSDSCVVQRLIQHGLAIVFPDNDEIERLHDIIIQELSNNIFTEESKQFYISVIQNLYDEQQVEGVVLGCTGKMTNLLCFF